MEHEHIFYDIGHDDIRCVSCNYITQKMGMEGSVTHGEALEYWMFTIGGEQKRLRSELLEQLEELGS